MWPFILVLRLVFRFVIGVTQPLPVSIPFSYWLPILFEFTKINRLPSALSEIPTTIYYLGYFFSRGLLADLSLTVHTLFTLRGHSIITRTRRGE